MGNKKGNKHNILKHSEKVEMAKKNFKEDISYKKLANMYNVSYTMVRKTCLKYMNHGEDGLISKSGKYERKNKKQFNIQ